jgi:hypothetical protein
MRAFLVRLLVISVGAGLFSLWGQLPAHARAGQVGHDDPWNSEHIDHLPPEVRNAVIRMCGPSPHAGHYFATYFDHARLIKLHFEYLQYNDEGRFCRDGTCLHQEYVATGGHYRLIKNYYGANND